MYINIFTRFLSIFFIFVGSLVGLTFGCFVFISSYPWIDTSLLQHETNVRPSILLDDEGNEWARFQIDKKEPLTITAVPDHVIQAFIAAEDRSFFKHTGISWRGIVRSFLVNLYHLKKMQGASTITQQLVRMLYFDPQKTFARKLKEQVVSLLLEQQLTKHQILELYLNNVYFGCGIYGIQAASQRFWNCSVQELTIDQAAALAAIMKSPGQYCPLLFPLSCQERRNIVLNAMRECNFISSDACQDLIKHPLVLAQPPELYAPHAREWIRGFVESIVGREQLYKGGLVIQTTLNLELQKVAQKEFEQRIQHVRTTMIPEIDGGLIVMEGASGEIKALIGGYDFASSKFDRASCAHRQFGSIFKPLVFAAAAQKGIQFNEVEVDEPFELLSGNNMWRPQNFSNEFDGPMTLAYALSHSNNITTIKTLLRIGAAPVAQLARECGIKSYIHEFPSLALGCIDGTLKEAAGMFNIFSQHGMYHEPHLVSWIKDQWGTKIWKVQPEKKQIVSSLVSGQVAHVLGLSLERLKKRFPELLQSDAIGKTGTAGTSDKCFSCWFIGSTPTHTTGIYMGCDDNRSLGRHIYGSGMAFPLWLTMQKYIPCTQKSFKYDPELKKKYIHEKTGSPCDAHDPHATSILIPI
jgi:penicillin-binding protein 1A